MVYNYWVYHWQNGFITNIQTEKEITNIEVMETIASEYKIPVEEFQHHNVFRAVDKKGADKYYYYLYPKR